MQGSLGKKVPCAMRLVKSYFMQDPYRVKGFYVNGTMQKGSICSLYVELFCVRVGRLKLVFLVPDAL